MGTGGHCVTCHQRGWSESLSWLPIVITSLPATFQIAGVLKKHCCMHEAFWECHDLSALYSHTWSSGVCRSMVRAVSPAGAEGKPQMSL